MTIIVTRHIPEVHSKILQRHARLGRHVEHDERSKNYELSLDLFPHFARNALSSVTHIIHSPVLDQGDLGSCTGNAAEECVSADPFYNAIPATNVAKPTVDAKKNEAQAIALYGAATKLDNIQGTYPPDDTGSTGLAVAKAAQMAGLIAGYQHALSLDAALAALTVTPVITGINWYEGFDQPDKNGLVKISGQIRGGHEVCGYAIDAPNRLVWFRQSWGQFGVNGNFCMSFDDWGRLLSEQGDVTVFVPLSQPAPVPTPGPAPTPTPSDVDKAMAQYMRNWLRAKGL